jgi:photosystem II stability/assembly factor-like uncharacterized protein
VKGHSLVARRDHVDITIHHEEVSMHRMIFILMLLSMTAVSGMAQPDWHWQNPIPQGNTLNAVDAISATSVVAVGADGTILRTGDGGVNWTLTKCAAGAATLYDVHFPTTAVGYAVGAQGTILKSADGGLSWSPLASGVGSTLYGVSFLNKDTGMVVGAGGLIRRTLNGGASWATMTTGTSADLYDASFKSTTLAIVVGDSNKILKSTTLGGSWVKKNVANSGYNRGVSFFNTTNGYAVGRDTCRLGLFGGQKVRFQYTTDGGESWVIDTTGACGISFVGSLLNYAVAMPGSATTYVVGASGLIVKQTTLGGDWTNQTGATSLNLRGVDFFSTSTGYAVGNNGVILRTTDGGTTWEPKFSAFTKNDHYGVDFFNAKNGFTVGSLGNQAFRTTNGGATWNATTLPSSVVLFAVEMLKTSEAVAVGDTGTIMKYSGGGWSTKKSGGSIDWRSVSFVDSLRGWVAGDSGFVVRTTDGGTNWSYQWPGTSSNLRGVKFVDSAYGWVVGALGAIFRTTNGGNSWSPQASGTSVLLTGVDFEDRSVGTAVGYNGTILRTENGGGSWSPQTSGITSNLTGVSFLDKKIGFCVATNGYLLFSSNSGTTWLIDSCETVNALSGVSYVDGSGTAVGSFGTVLRTDSGAFAGFPPPPFGSGNVVLLSSRPDTIKLVNSSMSTVEVTSITSTNPEFTASLIDWGAAPTIPDTGGAGFIFPDSSLRLVITFTPLTAGYKSGFLVITHSGITSPESLVITGTGVDPSVQQMFDFGYPPEQYPSNICITARHKDVMAMVMVVPETGTLDTLHFKMCDVGALDTTVFVRIFKSAVGKNSGPGHGSYQACMPWGYFPNTFDADQQIAAFSSDATGAWVSTVPGGPSSFPPAANELWGFSGFPVLVRPNAVNSVAMADLGFPLAVQKGDSLFVTIRVNGPVGHVEDLPTEFAAFRNDGAICKDSLVDTWKFFEHDITDPLCPGVPATKGWRTLCDGNYLGGIVYNWWFTMNSASSPPPVIEDFTELQNTTETGSQTVTAIVTGDIASVLICPCCDTIPCFEMTTTVADTWQGSIPGQEPGTVVCYQIAATDVYGRTTTSHQVQYTVVPTVTPYYSVDTIGSPLSHDISTTGTLISTGSFFLPSGFDGQPPTTDNGTAGPFDLGGPLVFYGDTVRYAWVGIDGALALTSSSTDTQHINISGFFGDFRIPSATFYEHDSGPSNFGNPFGNPKNLIAPLHGDLQIDTSLGEGENGIYIEYDSVEGEWIAQWNNLELKSAPFWNYWKADPGSALTGVLQRVPVTFRVIINRNRGWVAFQYDDVGTPLDRPDTNDIRLIGLQGEGPIDTIIQERKFFVLNRRGYPEPFFPHGGTQFKFQSVRQMNTCDGWTMVSLPLLPGNGNFSNSAIFPDAVSDAFSYCGSQYVPNTILEPGKGYWDKFPDALTLNLSGDIFSCVSIPVCDRWNMVGGTSEPVPTSSYILTGGSVASPFYTFGCSGYAPVSIIQPGMAAWVKVNAPSGGTFDVCAPAASPKTDGNAPGDALASLSRLDISDARGLAQSLYIGNERRLTIPAGYFELPPSPPAGMFDVRFASGRMVETYPSTSTGSENLDYTIILRDASYPVTLSYSVREDDQRTFLVTDAVGGRLIGENPLQGDGLIRIENPEAKQIVVRVIDGSALPTEYGLTQNYPNPFNPSTSIRYQLPFDSHVSLKVYDMLGRVVVTLSEGMQEAGYRSVIWDAEKYSSGVYHIVLDAVSGADPGNAYHKTMKAVLIK